MFSCDEKRPDRRHPLLHNDAQDVGDSSLRLQGHKPARPTGKVQRTGMQQRVGVEEHNCSFLLAHIGHGTRARSKPTECSMGCWKGTWTLMKDPEPTGDRRPMNADTKVVLG